MPAKKSSRKKGAAVVKLVPKIIQWPSDWIERIDELRGETSFSDFVRQAVLAQIGQHGLSEVPGWGQGRWKR